VSKLQESFLNRWLDIATRALRDTRQKSVRSDLSGSLNRIAMNLRVLAILVEARQATLDVDNEESDTDKSA
jgi:hypothetical protein